MPPPTPRSVIGNSSAAIKDLEEAVILFEKAKQNNRALESIVQLAQIAWQGLKVEDGH